MATKLSITTAMAEDSSIGSVTCVEIVDHVAIVSGGVGRARVLATTDGKKLQKRSPPSRRGLRGARILAGGKEWWLVGEYGLCSMSDDRGESWTQLEMPTRECLWDIVEDKKGVLWTCGSGATLLRSTDRRTWKPVKHKLKPRDDRADPRIEMVPAGLLFPLFNAVHDGKSFVKPKGLTGKLSSVAIGPTGTIVMVGDAGAAARSTDGGKTFKAGKIGVQTDFNDVAYVAGVVVAVGCKGMMRRSDDDGVTWKPLVSGTKRDLWSIGSWGDGGYIGGENGLVLRIEGPTDTYWRGCTDELKPKPIVAAVFDLVKPPTQAERDKTFATLYADATKEHAALAAKLKPGKLVRDEHDAAILAAPDDVDAYRVYGDVLQGRGDLRGELVALQTTEGHEKAAHQFIAEHKAELLGAFAETENAVEVEWKHGFIHELKIKNGSEPYEDEGGEAKPVPKTLEALLAEPSARFLQKLTVGIVEFEDNSYDEVIAVLAKHPLPALRSLFLGDFESEETEISWSSLGDASKLCAALGNLEDLVLRSGGMKLGRLVFPKLRGLSIITGGFDKKNLKSIERAELPSLERLALCIGTDRYGCDIQRRDLMPLLASDRFPKLRVLGIQNSEFIDELCAYLHTSRLVAQVSELDLSLGIMSDKGARAIATYAAAYAHLDKLDVSSNYITKAGLKALKTALPNTEILATRQREAEGPDDRYVSVSE